MKLVILLCNVLYIGSLSKGGNQELLSILGIIDGWEWGLWKNVWRRRCRWNVRSEDFRESAILDDEAEREGINFKPRLRTISSFLLRRGTSSRLKRLLLGTDIWFNSLSSCSLVRMRCCCCDPGDVGHSFLFLFLDRGFFLHDGSCCCKRSCVWSWMIGNCWSKSWSESVGENEIDRDRGCIDALVEEYLLCHARMSFLDSSCCFYDTILEDFCPLFLRAYSLVQLHWCWQYLRLVE